LNVLSYIKYTPPLFSHYKTGIRFIILIVALIIVGCSNSKKLTGSNSKNESSSPQRQVISLNEGWRFMKYTSTQTDSLFYDVRPTITDRNDNKVADSKPTDAVAASTTNQGLKKWILPTANPFIKDTSKHFSRPIGNPGENFPFVKNTFNDNEWENVTLPHDWAIKAPFYTEVNATVGGGMGRLPVHGVGWYRNKIEITEADLQKNIYLDIDGAMSYAIVWVNGKLVGGWPYGYNSFRLDITPFVKVGNDNQIAIRVDNPNHSARWYPGGGIYRNMWLTKVGKVQVAHWGSFVTTSNVSTNSANIHLQLQVQNTTTVKQKIKAVTNLFVVGENGERSKRAIATFPEQLIEVPINATHNFTNSLVLKKPMLWGPPPEQVPHLYMAVTKLFVDGQQVDEYETKFGIRTIKFDAEKGFFVNDKPVRFQGVNQHHDLGALGAAFNRRAAERQLELLEELGCNAIRMSHNPPAPELLDLTDEKGFLVIDEIFDSWEKKKTPHDFHLIFPDWHEADTRNFIRRDRNHPSVIAWSYGNEVGEQYTADTGAIVSKKLYDIVKEEDSTRPATASMNYAKPYMPFPAVMDILSLNYQGEGIRDAPAYAHLKGIRTNPLYPAFHQQFPNKLIVSSETSSALSTRSSYVFPVTAGNSAPVSDSTGGDPISKQVSAYELYTAQFGASPDKVFASQDKHPFVAGEFVWSGWDYLGEPTPYYTARSSYCGIIDLAGFKKDRFYLYQSRWRPDLPMAHILPHWNWPDRMGKITPVHVFTSGDEAELFLNGKSWGKKKKNLFEYRIRWDDVIYEPGELKVISYKSGKVWAQDIVKTSGIAEKLLISADRAVLNANGVDLSFIKVEVVDKNGLSVPDANNKIEFKVEGAGILEATDNGDPANMVSFSSPVKEAYFGLALGIIKTIKNKSGEIIITVTSPGLKGATIILSSK
jgi:beta-galactosidase